MKIYLLFFLTATCVAQSHCVINEIMFAPLGGEPEWVEVYNPSSQSFDLKNWKIRNMSATLKTITTKDVIIDPGEYIVLTHDTTIFNYHAEILSPVIALTLPSLNNDSGAVIIYNAAGSIVDSLVYHSTWGGAGGASIERIRASMPSTLKDNWRTSVDIEKSTPGRRNSVAPKPVDAALDSITAQLTDRNLFAVTAFIRNNGELNVYGLCARFAIDLNKNNLIDSNEIFCDSLIGTLPASGMQLVSCATPRLLSSGNILAEIISPGDGDSTNNFSSVHVNVHQLRLSVVLNEIMFAPLAPEPEWIEVQNQFIDTIDCSGWKISTGTSGGTLNTAPLLAPGDYLIIVHDTTAFATAHPDAVAHAVYAAVPTLNNTAGKIILRDDLNETIDSLAYNSTWGGTSGASLERIDSSGLTNDSTNWRSSIDTSGNTCARRNSIARRGIDAGIVSAMLNDDTSAVIVTVRNYGLNNALNIQVAARVDSMNDANNTLASSVVSLYNGSLTTLTVPLAKLPLGDNRITVCAEVANDEQPLNNCVQLIVRGSIPKNILAVNEIMFAPRTGSTEYFELANTGTSPVNLFGCKYAGAVSLATHRADTMAFAAEPAVLDPGGYAVIAADTTIFSAFPDMPASAKIIIENKSTMGLNNDSDIVVITDARGATIDSVDYSGGWQSANVKSASGVALEKINPRAAANDPASWASSVAARGGTPGARNSVFTIANVLTGKIVMPSAATLSVSPNPFSPDGDGFEDNTTFHYTLPFASSTIALRVYDVNGRLKRALINTNRSASESGVAWDGRDDDGAALPIGIYIAVLDAADAASGAVLRATCSVVVARRM